MQRTKKQKQNVHEMKCHISMADELKEMELEMKYYKEELVLTWRSQFKFSDKASDECSCTE